MDPASRIRPLASPADAAEAHSAARTRPCPAKRGVAVLHGGLAAWRQAGLATQPFPGDEARGPAGAVAFPTLAERHLREVGRPTRLSLATLFVDIAGSTRLLAHYPPETVLTCIQRFMRLVADVALAYCGDVKDFEGDGVLLYFESASEAVEAALAIRGALASGICDVAGCPLVARMSITVGDVVLGVVGSKHRHAVALVGPSVSVGARLLKQLRPGGITATAEVVDTVREEMPELAHDFVLLNAAFEVPATEGIVVATWAIGPDASPPEDVAMTPGITDVCRPTTASTRNADAASKVPTVSRATWTAITRRRCSDESGVTRVQFKARSTRKPPLRSA